MKMQFQLQQASGKKEEITLDLQKIINAGYTGRDQAAVQAHIDELKEEGIPAPDKTPTYFPKFIDRLSQTEDIEVLDESDHSGEAEFVLIFDGKNVYVGVGSDHTDRKLETVDIPKAKQVYINTISKDLWNLADVVGHWDEMILRSWVKQDGKKVLFQEATLDAMLAPEDLIARVKKLLVKPDNTDGLVVYSGTVAALCKTDYSNYFEVEIEDPKLGRKLSQKYTLNPVSNWYKGD
ncbi:DUF2848 domain-containing protein [Synergistaceae bacterium OttesenSCG-928-D05]|nr:DUF2848 domain-containing protein [Synergistaceae bacterium OttesenSCG-928-D05]